jgi:Ca-activated chloride channel family protein
MSRTSLTLILASSLTAVALVGCGKHSPAFDRGTESTVIEEAGKKDLQPQSQAAADGDASTMSEAGPTAQPAPELAANKARPMVIAESVAVADLSESEAVRPGALSRSMTGGVMHRPNPPPMPDAMHPVVTEGGYTDYGVNAFVTAGEDNLSTFAIDVDTASYTMARKSLSGGYLPASGAVRVEEFVNYFPYEYDRPRAQEPFTVDFEATPSPWDEQLTLLRVGVQGKTVTYEERKPVHLTFLVDVSGSMRSADKLGLVKTSLMMLTEELEDGDTVAIATYAGATKVVLPPTPISEKNKIIRSLSGLNAGGSTAMNSGIQLAYNLADKTYKPGSVNRVLVCSDGDANVGQVAVASMSAGIRGYAEKGITLTTLGFGNGNYKDTRMEQLANQGDGNYFYIDTDREARRVLVDKLAGTLEVIAKDVKIQVDFDPDAVLAYRLVGYENRDVADRDFRNDKVDAGEIGAGHQVTALYEVQMHPKAKGDVATVRVRHKAPGPDAPAAEGSWTLSMHSVRSSFAEGSRGFRIAASAGYFAEILRGSPHVREISLSQVAELARKAERPEYGEDRELVQLIETASRLKGEGAVTMR